MSGITEIMEMLEGCAVVGEAAADIAKDGLGLDDVPKAIELAKKHEVILAAIKGADQIPAEAKDLSLAEAQQLIAKVIEVATRIKAKV